MTTFKEYWTALSPDAKRKLAKDADTSVNHLAQLACGNRNAGANLMSRLMVARPELTAEILRPDLFKVA